MIRPMIRPFLLGLLSFTIVAAHAEPNRKSEFDFSTLESVPVQVGGRLKPFESFAQDTVLGITGRMNFKGWKSTELLLSWITAPKEWENERFILISRPDVKRQLGLPEAETRFSPKELLDQSSLIDYATTGAGQAGGMSAQATPIAVTSKPDPRSEELKRVINRVALYRAVILGQAWQVIPTPSPQPWLALREGDPANGVDFSSMPGAKVREKYFKIFSAYLYNDYVNFAGLVKDLDELVKGEMGKDWNAEATSSVNAEIWYQRVHPFQKSWILYLVAALLWASAIWLKGKSLEKWLTRSALAVTGVGFLLHISGMVIRSYVAGRPPVTNMYESIIWVAFGVVFFGLILYYLQRNPILTAVATTLGMLTLIVADAAPVVMDPGIHPLVPVLRSNMWLTVHVLTITISYAALALTMGLGNVALFHYLKGVHLTPTGMQKITTLNYLSYRAMQFGVVLLAAGTILGGVWADYSWGRFWGWDPKEVWALIALLGYLAVLHARYTGWMKAFGFAAWTVVSFALVVMAWYGVNFVLGVGLHSYGFSSGGQSTVAIFLLAQFLYVAIVAIRVKAGSKRMKNT